MRGAVLKLGTAIAILALAPAASASVEKLSRHTLGSGEGVYNIQLIDIGPLQVFETGDPKSEGELHSVKIKLLHGHWEADYQDQFDSRTYRSPFLWSDNGPKGNFAYLPIKTGQMVTLGNPRGPVAPDDLWLHARANPVYGHDEPRLHFGVTIEARELDCTRERVCRRGNTSSTSVRFNLPEPSGPFPYNCTPSNTWEVIPVDGELKLLAPGAETSRVWREEKDFYNGRVFESDGPNLSLFNAKICITRSTREAWRDTIQNRQGEAERQGRRNRNRIGSDLKND